MGLAGSLLVFTGFWHVFEWMMGGRNKDTLRLVPVGIIYIILGYLIVTFTGGKPVLVVALIATSIGAVAAYTQRGTAQIRPWVMWAFFGIDVLIILDLLSALIG